MASPQKENGFTTISNEVLEKIYSFSFTNSELRVLLFIIRKTWGWHKKEDKISYNQIADSTNTTRRNAIYLVKSLVKKQALVVKKGYINTISFNKNYDTWLPSEETSTTSQLVKKQALPSEETSTTLVKKQALELVKAPSPTKEKKETIQKKLIQKKRIYAISEEYFISISGRYKVPLALVKLAKEEMDNWLEAKGKHYEGFNGYKAGLRNWVLRDAKKQIERRDNGQSRVAIDVTKLRPGV